MNLRTYRTFALRKATLVGAAERIEVLAGPVIEAASFCLSTHRKSTLRGSAEIKAAERIEHLAGPVGKAASFILSTHRTGALRGATQLGTFGRRQHLTGTVGQTAGLRFFARLARDNEGQIERTAAFMLEVPGYTEIVSADINRYPFRIIFIKGIEKISIRKEIKRIALVYNTPFYIQRFIDTR